MPETIDNLLAAAGRGNLDKTKQLIDGGQDVNDSNDIGYRIDFRS